MKVLAVFLLFLLLLDISIQVFARYFLPYSPSWTEEAARFILLYLVALGSGLAMQAGMFVNVDLIFYVKNLPDHFISLIKIFSNMVIFVSCLVIGISSIPLIAIGRSQISAAMLMPMHIIFWVMMILPVNIIIVQVYQLLRAMWHK